MLEGIPVKAIALVRAFRIAASVVHRRLSLAE
jgi:hypothetical protein